MCNEVIEFEGIESYIDYTNLRLKILNYEILSKELLLKVLVLARDKGLGKVLCNCRVRDLVFFRKMGFVVEGLISGFFRGRDAYCVSFFLNKDRVHSKREEEEEEILKMCFDEKRISKPRKIDEQYKIRDCVEDDIPQMIKLFKKVFKTYPAPVFEEEYLREMINEKILFKGVFSTNGLISIASADLDSKNLNAEITDCATYPKYRGRGLLSNLINELEEDLKARGYYILYSLSRAINAGINISLRKQGYYYGGRLINNCNICGGFEDMNIWIKNLKPNVLSKPDKRKNTTVQQGRFVPH